MSLVHDLIKMHYVREGYLPNYPYHLISDKEMCEAFISETTPCYFYDNYPLITKQLEKPYELLVTRLQAQIESLKASHDAEYVLPDWVYSYMLGRVISINSSISDIHDMLVMMNRDNIDDLFTPEASIECYKISVKWLSKLPPDKSIDRVPTIFGELHVIKSLRLAETSTRFTQTTPKTNLEVAAEFVAGQWGYGDACRQKLEAAGYSYDTIKLLADKLAIDGRI